MHQLLASCPTVESVYAILLFKELKNARILAKKNIQSTQKIQKGSMIKRLRVSRSLLET